MGNGQTTQAKLQFLIVFTVRYWHIKYSVYLRGDEHKRQVCKCGRKSWMAKSDNLYSTICATMDESLNLSEPKFLISKQASADYGCCKS